MARRYASRSLPEGRTLCVIRFIHSRPAMLSATENTRHTRLGGVATASRNDADSAVPTPRNPSGRAVRTRRVRRECAVKTATCCDNAASERNRSAACVSAATTKPPSVTQVASSTPSSRCAPTSRSALNPLTTPANGWEVCSRFPMVVASSCGNRSVSTSRDSASRDGIPDSTADARKSHISASVMVGAVSARCGRAGSARCRGRAQRRAALRSNSRKVRGARNTVNAAATGTQRAMPFMSGDDCRVARCQ